MTILRIDLFDTEEYVKLNNLKEVKSHMLFQRGGVPNPDGLISNEIFGVTVQSRKETFAYIDLHGYFFNPHIYKAIKRFSRKITKIVAGEEHYIINKDGDLIQDEDTGETGLDFLYNNWEKISWDKVQNVASMRNERIDMISHYKKNEIFMKYLIVIPAFYRDVRSDGGSSGSVKSDPVNAMYSKIIRSASSLKTSYMLDFQFNTTNVNIQDGLVEIYDYFKQKLEKKTGLIRRYLLGKNTDRAVRAVISTPLYHANRPEELLIDYRHSGVPIYQCCSMIYPFLIRWIKNFFEKEIFDNQYLKSFRDPHSGKDIETVELRSDIRKIYNDDFYRKMIDTFIKDPGSRFNQFPIPTNEYDNLYLQFTGTKYGGESGAVLANMNTRRMTWTDLLYIACEDIVKDKHVLVTRYPVTDAFGIFYTKIRLLSTIETMPVQFNGRVYPFYPVIDLSLTHDEIATKFIDTMEFSNSYLNGIGGDYDGDQITARIIWSQEANKEIEDKMNSKSFFLSINGDNVRKIGNEATQTFYALTKDPKNTDKILNVDDKKYILSLNTNKLGVEDFVKLFGYYTNGVKSTNDTNPKFNPTDKMTLYKHEYEYIPDTKIETTVGRYLFNRVLLEYVDVIKVTGYINYPITDKGLGKLESMLTLGLKEDKITTENMFKYTNTRDWLGLSIHSFLTPSFTPMTVQRPKEVTKLKNELMKKYNKELKAGNAAVSEDIEHELVDKTLEVMKDDIGLDLYESGARGSVSNNLKNMFLFRGAVKDEVNGGFNIIENSLTDGLTKKDIPAHSNTILGGAYPKAVGTADTGYLSKQLLAGLQTEVLADPGSDCGTKKTISVIIPEKTTDFEYRYIIENGKLVCLTPDIIKNYIGKRVNLRSPMMCTRINGEICSKCAGEYFYNLGYRNIGLTATRVATTLTNLNMKKFHENLIKYKQINPDEILI